MLNNVTVTHPIYCRGRTVSSRRQTPFWARPWFRRNRSITLPTITITTTDNDDDDGGFIPDYRRRTRIEKRWEQQCAVTIIIIFCIIKLHARRPVYACGHGVPVAAIVRILVRKISIIHLHVSSARKQYNMYTT